MPSRKLIGAGTDLGWGVEEDDPTDAATHQEGSARCGRRQPFGLLPEAALQFAIVGLGAGLPADRVSLELHAAVRTVVRAAGGGGAMTRTGAPIWRGG
jgi:hypothetical protein